MREDNHPLLVRAGYMRGREYLFLGQRTLAKVTAIMRERSDRSVAQTLRSKVYRAGDDFVAVLEKLASGFWCAGRNYAALLGCAAGIAKPPAVADPDWRS